MLYFSLDVVPVESAGIAAKSIYERRIRWVTNSASGINLVAALTWNGDLANEHGDGDGGRGTDTRTEDGGPRRWYDKRKKGGPTDSEDNA